MNAVKRVLVVDDKEDNLALLQALLAGSGYAVDQARHGAEALVKARAAPPDIVVSDLLMPVMDGYTLLRQWKADESLRHIPFIVYTATYTDPKDEQLALDLGADAFIVKPAEPVAFMARLEEVLSRTSANGVAAHSSIVGDEKVLLRQYSETLIHKLEEKLRQMEEQNRALQQALMERKQLMQALTDSEKNLRDIIDGLGPDVFVGLLTPEGAVLEANQSALGAAGLRLDEVRGRPVEETFWFSYSKEVQRQIRDAVNRAACGEASRFDVRVRLAGDQFGVIDLSLRPLLDERSQVRLLVPSANVITERKQAEQQLAESERRLREIFESANVGIALADPEDRILEANKWFSEVLGYSREEMLRLHTFDLVHPDDIAESRRMTEAVHRGVSASHRAERRYVRKDGSAIRVSLFASTVFDDAGREKYSIGVVSDITDRWQAEQELRASEDRFARVFRSSPLGISLSRLEDGRFIDVNESFLGMFGYRREEVIGRTSTELGMWCSPSDREVLARELAASGGFRNREHSFARRNGVTGWALCAAEVIRIGGDAIVLSLFNDITERRRAAAVLREREEQLRLFVEHSPAAIAMFDRDMRYIVVSRRFLSDYQLGDRDITGRSHYEVFPEITDRWRNIHQRCLAGAIERCESDLFVRADGRADWVCWEIRPWHRAEDGIGGIILFSEVITERMRADTALRASEERLRALSARLLVAQEQERAAIARELHDELGQILTALKLGVQGLAHVAKAALPGTLDRLVAMVDQSLGKVRRMSLDLRPPQLDDIGLAAALRSYLDRAVPPGGPRLELRVADNLSPLPPGLATTCFRIVQEATTNALRHAVAGNISIALALHAGNVSIEVRDDGAGFDLERARAAARHGGSLGLLSMEERARLAGGVLEIETGAGSGTCVRALLPPGLAPADQA